MEPSCKSSTPRVYQEVIDDVIHNVRDIFLADGMDESVVQQLKALWEKKLAATNAVSGFNTNDGAGAHCSNNPPLQTESGSNQLLPEIKQEVSEVDIGATSLELPVTFTLAPDVAFPEWPRTPIQITIPPQMGECMKVERVLTVYVPEIFVQGGQLNEIVTGDAIAATLNMTFESAQIYLQEQVNQAAFCKYQQMHEFVNLEDGIGLERPVLEDNTTLAADQSGKCLFTCDGSAQQQTVNDELNQEQKVYFELKPASFSNEKIPSTNQINQLDGMHNSSDDDVNEGSARKRPHTSVSNGGEASGSKAARNTSHDHDDESLNSNDDLSDPDGSNNSFECENVIVCQFEKVARARNRWKLNLKDGVAHLNGKDYVFHKANGDAEW